MLFLKPWSKEMDITEELETVPIWIRFPGLKLHYYTKKSLSKLASFVDKLLYTDKMTATQERISYARVSVELKMDHKLPDCVPYINEFGLAQSQPVEYEWLPPWCKECTKFGHIIKFCPNKPELKSVWVPKAKGPEQSTTSSTVQPSLGPEDEEVTHDESPIVSRPPAEPTVNACGDASMEPIEPIVPPLDDFPPLPRNGPSTSTANKFKLLADVGEMTEEVSNSGGNKEKKKIDQPLPLKRSSQIQNQVKEQRRKGGGASVWSCVLRKCKIKRDPKG
ncbi:uncharacterized protein [Coffea arabica]|nr:uncharacterized protein LOC113727276 isoform X1 [Coffea arabica]XP_027107130.1 uncharacterized protein LOC113727276 isoform X1 [Coffea arabica]